MSKIIDQDITVNQQQAKFTKFSRLQWNKIEKSLRRSDHKSCIDTMQKLGGNTSNTIDIVANVKVCRDDVYRCVRQKLFDNELIDADTFLMDNIKKIQQTQNKKKEIIKRLQLNCQKKNN